VRDDSEEPGGDANKNTINIPSSANYLLQCESTLVFGDNLSKPIETRRQTACRISYDPASMASSLLVC
jgi:hypothetical protein